MADSPLGANAHDSVVDRIKADQRALVQSLRKSALADGRPPGTVPVRDPARQLQILEGLAANGQRLTEHERNKLMQLRQKSPLVR